MASPRPAPPGRSVARWNRSKIRVALGPRGCPGPRRRRSAGPAARRSRPRRRPCRPAGAYLQALSRRTPSRRSSHSGGRGDDCARRRAVEVEPQSRRGLGDDPEPVDGLRRPGPPRSTGSASGGSLRGVEPGEPEEVVEQPAHPLDLDVDPAERRAVPAGRRGPGRGRGWCGPRSPTAASAARARRRR